jgi:hypothetical protein
MDITVIGRGNIVSSAVLYDQIDQQRVPPSNLYASEDAAREVRCG